MEVITSDTHRQHHSLELDTGVVIPSWESPERVEFIEAALRRAGHDFGGPDELDVDLLRRVHDPRYLEFLQGAWDAWQRLDDAGPAAMGFAWPVRGMPAHRPDDIVGQLGYYSFAADCSIVGGTWTAASAAAAIAQTAADKVLAEPNRTPYGLCRPPGHHASADQFGGYCYVNNAAIAAQRLLDGGMQRVAVLDVDYHHGNGTQAIFYERSDVVFVSIHADPADEFPWFAGRGSETGEGSGIGANLNLPLPAGTTMRRWAEALTTAVRFIDESSCDALVVSLGVDTYRDDPISRFLLETADFDRMGCQVRDVGLPTVVLQEGGYATEAIGSNVATFLEPFRG